MSEYFGLFFPFMDKETKAVKDMEKDARKPRVIRGVSWNAYVNNRAPRENLRALIDTTRNPHFLCLQEMYKHDDIKVNGYRKIVKQGGNPRDSNNMILVRDDIEIGQRRDINVNGNKWTGPESGARYNQPPRHFPGVTINVHGQRWDIWSVHRCTGGFNRRKPENMKEWRAEHEALRQTAGRRDDTRPRRPGLFVGDWNDPFADPRRYGIRQLARQIDGSGTVLGIDGVINWNCKITRARKLANKFGSDTHAPVVFMAESR